MSEFIEGIGTLTYWDIFTDIHGFLAMLVLILFGLALAFYVMLTTNPAAARWLKSTLYALFGGLAVLDFFGMYMYGAYRATTGPRTFLKSSPDTAWLHNIMFEHKEFLAFAPLVIIAAAAIIVALLGERIAQREYTGLRRIVLFSIISSLAIVLAVAGEAVLITKVAPLR